MQKPKCNCKCKCFLIVSNNYANYECGANMTDYISYGYQCRAIPVQIFPLSPDKVKFPIISCLIILVVKSHESNTTVFVLQIYLHATCVVMLDLF